MLCNTTKHIRYALAAAVVIGLIIRLLNVREAVIFAAIVFALGTVGWENSQRLRSTDPNYLNKRWLDSIVDIAVANIAFNAMFWAIMWKAWYFV
jgi:hypothetical protein